MLEDKYYLETLVLILRELDSALNYTSLCL